MYTIHDIPSILYQSEKRSLKYKDIFLKASITNHFKNTFELKRQKRKYDFGENDIVYVQFILFLHSTFVDEQLPNVLYFGVAICVLKLLQTSPH